MSPRRRRIPLSVLAAAIALGAALAGGPARAEAPEDLEGIADMDLAELADVRITAATGIPQPISQAPAVATVITAEEIAAMGALSLEEVLETVAGLHVVPSKVRRMNPIYSIRGIHSGHNAQVLTLLNGVPITQGFAGGPAFGFRLPLAGIARIEVVRGTGSAVYGADAFAGVINVVTKTASDLAGVEAGVRAGSFGTSNAWLGAGGKLCGWDAALSLEWLGTDGDDDRIVEVDQQTALDAIFHTAASRAPGPVSTPSEVVNIHLDLARGPWAVRWWGYRNADSGTGTGFANALDPDGRERVSQSLLDVERRFAPGEDWELSARFTYLYLDQAEASRFFPPGTVLPIGTDGNVDFVSPVGLVVFPDGLIGQPGDREHTLSLDTVAVYRGLAGHQIRLGTGAIRQEVHARERKNFGPGVIDGSQPVVDGTLTDVTDTPFTFLPDQDREQWFVSLQDQWSIGPTWQVTAGLRYDEYSDFGGTLNPRIAVVWAARPDLTAKLLYGSAFRAPSFAELNAANNPAVLGNPELEPETIDTFELAFDYRPGRRLRTAVSVFTYRGEDLIELVPDPGARTRTSRNFRTQEGYGLELEAEWNVSRELRLEGNVAWQHSEDDRTGARIADAAGSQAFAALEWRPSATWTLRPELHWIGDRHRERDDPRPPVEDYALVDFVVRHQPVRRTWSVAVVGRNLLDEEAREPAGPEIPGDFPLSGRSLVLELRGRL